MRNIQISDEVYNKIAKEGKFGETTDDVLRRKYGITDNPYKQNIRTRRGLLPPDETLCKMKYTGKVFNGEIENGFLVISGIGQFSSLSGASRGVTNTNRDGWYDWYLLLPNTSGWIFANDWRRDNNEE